MRRVALAIAGTVTGLVMLLSFKTHSTTSTAGTPAAATGNTGRDTPEGTATTSPSTVPAPPTSGSAGATPSSSPPAGTTKSVTGDAADTRYGPVQVQVTVSNGTLAAVNAVEYPQDTPRDQEINSFAIPQLNSEALAAKSAKIDMVSGATYTSEGYLSSLQSALDKAGL